MSRRYAVRPVRMEDLDAFLELSRVTGGELTNISSERAVVEWRLEESIRSFAMRSGKPGSYRYLFLVEDLAARKLAGTCGIISKVGGFQPFYCYDLASEIFRYSPLGIDHEIQTLSPNRKYNGPSEICCLFLRPEYRRSGLGRLLSLSRFHFMGEFPERFDSKVIAELRGVAEGGEPPFWKHVARHFFKMDFRRADYLSGLDDKEFIERLMPEHPLYLPLLPAKAREVIGKAHPDAEPALGMLMKEGFQFRGQIDIFDAGPIVEAEVQEIRTVRELCNTIVVRIDGAPPEGEQFFVSNRRLDFRCCVAPLVACGREGVRIGREDAALLEVKEGDRVAYSPLKSEKAALRLARNSTKYRRERGAA